MAKRIAVVVSQGQSKNPVKRTLEEDLITALIFEQGLDVTVVPNLYDLDSDGTGILALQGIKGDMVMLSWLFPRAAHWVLDRNGVHGQVGEVELKSDAEEEDEDELDDELEEDVDDDKLRVIDQRELPDRKIYCINLSASEQVADFVAEVKRISEDASTRVFGLTLWNDDESNGNGKEAPSSGNGQHHAPPVAAEKENAEPVRIEESAGRRWYPVIDYSRCTNCMECVDFCLFGVYGVDAAETILVELPDNCRKGCPACSRVCPENAIIFPQHKTPSIAGAPVATGGLKIDLSLLFGAPDAVEIAAKERDEQLLLAGRDAVGMSEGIPKRQANLASEPKDDLDNLIDELDDMDL